METKTFIYMKGGTYYECSLTLDQLEERIKLAGKELGKFMGIPCILTLNINGAKSKTVRNYYIDCTEIMTYVDMLEDLTPPEEPKIETKEAEIQEIQEDLGKKMKGKK